MDTTDGRQLMGPTLEQVKDAAAMQGVPTDQAEQFWLHYEAQDWKRANDQPVKNWRALLTLWCRDVYGMQKVTPASQSRAPRTCKCGQAATLHTGSRDWCRKCYQESLKNG